MLSNCGNEQELSFIPIDAGNLALFRSQNTLLFPIQYPDKFYSSLLHLKSVKAYLVYSGSECVGSFSVRQEPLSRWTELTSGRVVDNFSPVSSLEGEETMYYIMTLGVLAVHRRLGIGARILSSVIADARREGVSCIGLHVHVENRAALKFYERFGFQVLGVVDNYYKKISPNSAYILELKL